jgi:hypothetical protein
MPEPESLLTEIDRRLASIQAELAPDRASPRPGRAGPLAEILEPGPESRARERSSREPSPEQAALARQVRSLAQEQAKLTVACEQLQARFDRLAPAPEEFSVSAGPFEGTDSLRAFERALAELPGVAHVAIRAYEGDDRAILDVELEPRAAGGRYTVI